MKPHTNRNLSIKIKNINKYLLVSHLILIIYQILFWNYISDDAFISMRYAKNFYDYNQMSFNVNETPVEGYSNFLWIILLVFSFALKFNPIIFVKVSGLIFCHLSIFVLYKTAFLINENKKFGNLIIIFYAIIPNIALWSIGGLETSLFTLLLLTSIFFFIIGITKRKDKFVKISPFFFILLSLTRPEGAILFVISFLYFFYIFLKEKTIFTLNSILKLIIFGTSFLIVYLPYFIWRISYFNNILPQTFIAKKGTYSVLLFYYRILFFKWLILSLIPVLFLIFFYILRNFKTFFSDDKKVFIFLLILTLSVLLLLIRSYMPGFRFTVPIIPLIFLLLPKSLNFLIIFKDKFIENIQMWKRFKFITVFIICISNFLIIFSFYPSVLKHGDGMKECNYVLGRWIKENSDENCSLAIWDVGAIPYYAEIRTIDIHANSLQDLVISKNHTDVNYILNQNITFIIINEFFDYIKEDQRFIDNYKLIFIVLYYKGDIWHPEDYLYEVYLFNGYYISQIAIDELINSSQRFFI